MGDRVVDQIPSHLRIAALKILGDAIGSVAAGERASFARANPRGTRLPVVSHRVDEAGDPIQLGAVAVEKGRTSFSIADEEAAIDYLVDRYGAQAVEEVTELRIRPQYANSLLAEAKKAHADKKPLPPGVHVSTAPRHTTFAKTRGVTDEQLFDELMTMIRDGRLELRQLFDGATFPPELISGEQKDQ